MYIITSTYLIIIFFRGKSLYRMLDKIPKLTLILLCPPMSLPQKRVKDVPFAQLFVANAFFFQDSKYAFVRIK